MEETPLTWKAAVLPKIKHWSTLNASEANPKAKNPGKAKCVYDRCAARAALQ